MMKQSRNQEIYPQHVEVNGTAVAWVGPVGNRILKKKLAKIYGYTHLSKTRQLRKEWQQERWKTKTEKRKMQDEMDNKDPVAKY